MTKILLSQLLSQEKAEVASLSGVRNPSDIRARGFGTRLIALSFALFFSAEGLAETPEASHASTNRLTSYNALFDFDFVPIEDLQSRKKRD